MTPASHESAGDAVKRMFDFVATGQWGREWDESHPGQQSLVSREEYVDCAQGSSLNITSVDVVETHDDPIDLTGVPEKTSEAVTVKLSTAEDTTTVIVHEVLVAGEWRWVLGNIAIATFEGGRCP